MTNQTTRVLELLKRFNNNQKVCIKALQNEYLWEGKSERTIQRDLEVIKDIFPNSFETIRGEGCYKAVTKKSFENFLTPQNISLLVQAFNITQASDSFESFDLDRDDRSIIENKIKESKKIYEFKNKPFERKSGDSELFHLLEESIYQQKVLKIEYDAKTLELKPYKILFMHENFYLACERENKFKFSLLRISKIKKEHITQQAKTFHKNPEILDFIKDIQTPFSTYSPDYKNRLIDVVLEVDASKAFFFKNKNFLKSQTIIKEREDGNLLISYKVTQFKELDELIKKWIPYIRVVEPIALKEQLKSELSEYLRSLVG